MNRRNEIAKIIADNFYCLIEVCESFNRATLWLADSIIALDKPTGVVKCDKCWGIPHTGHVCEKCRGSGKIVTDLTLEEAREAAKKDTSDEEL